MDLALVCQFIIIITIAIVIAEGSRAQAGQQAGRHAARLRQS